MRRYVYLMALVVGLAGIALLAVSARGFLGDGGEPALNTGEGLIRTEPGPMAEPLPEKAEAGYSGLATRDSAFQAPPVGGEPVAPPLPELLGRKIIRNARLEMEVEDVLRAVQEVENIAASVGGFVAASSVFTEEPPRPLEEGEPQVRQEEPPKRTQTATVTIRVPSDQYSSVMARLRGIAREVRGESASTSDVTEEYADLEARRRNLEATEATLLKLLAQAETIQDILLLQDRINGVRLEIERIRGRINLLNDLSELATLEVHLRPFVVAPEVPEEKGWAAEAAENAWEVSQAALQALGTGAIVGGVLLAWLAVPAAAGLVAWRLLRPRRAGSGEA